MNSINFFSKAFLTLTIALSSISGVMAQTLTNSSWTIDQTYGTPTAPVTLTTSGTVTLTVNKGVTVTIYGTLKVPDKLVKKGEGRLIINGIIDCEEDWGTDGTVEINAGVLELGYLNGKQPWFNCINDLIGNGTASKFAVNIPSSATKLDYNTLFHGSTNGEGVDAILVVRSGTLQLSSSAYSVASIEVEQYAVAEISGSTDKNISTAELGIVHFNVASGSTITYSGVMSGDGTLIKSGTGKLTLSKANTYKGSTYISAGTLTLDANGTIAQSSVVEMYDENNNNATFAIEANKTIKSLRSTQSGDAVNLGAYYLTIAETGNNTFAGKISGGGGITKTGAGTLSLTGTSTYTGTTTPQEGTIEFSSAASLGTGPIVFQGGTLKWASGNTADISARINAIRTGGATFENGSDVTFGTAFPSSSEANAGPVTKKGAGTLKVTKANTFTGDISINEGIFEINAAGSVASQKITVANNATLTLSRSSNWTYGGVIAGTGKVSILNTGVILLTGSNTHTGLTFIDGSASLIIGNGSAGSIASPTITVNTAANTVTFNRNNYTYSGVISGAGNVKYAGTETLTLSGANTYTGATEISGNGTLILTGTIANSSGVVISGASGKFQINAAKTIAGLESTQSNSQVILNGTLTINGKKDQTFAGKISGTGGLNLSYYGGIGKLTSTFSFTLNGENSYEGQTTVKVGTLKLGASGTITKSAVLLDRVSLLYYGNLDISAGNKTLTSLSANYGATRTGTGKKLPVLSKTGNSVTLGSSTLQIGTGSSSADGGGTFKGFFTGNGNVIKTGGAQFTLAGDNDATGTLTVANGTLVLTDGAGWAGNLTQQAGSSYLEIQGSADIDKALNLQGGTINMSLTATPAQIVAGGAASATGLTTINVAAPAGTHTLIAAASGLSDASKFKIVHSGNMDVTTEATGKELNITVAAPTTPVTGITLSATSLSLETGKSAKLTATVTPSDASDKSVSWTSSDGSIASVDNAGNVKAVSAGTCTITATTSNPNITATCQVTVTDPSPTTVSVTGINTTSPTSVSIEKGKTATLSVSVAPSNATNKTVSWSSDDTSVATVSNGIVTGKAVGTAVISATTQDGGYSVSFTVSVTSPVANEAVAASAVWSAGNAVYLRLPAAETVQIYNITGALVKTVSAPAGESSFTLPGGLYIIKTKSQTVRSIVK